MLNVFNVSLSTYLPKTEEAQAQVYDVKNRKEQEQEFQSLQISTTEPSLANSEENSYSRQQHMQPEKPIRTRLPHDWVKSPQDEPEFIPETGVLEQSSVHQGTSAQTPKRKLRDGL